LDKHELARALEFMKINMRFFDYLWITLDVDNNGFIENWEFVKNWNSSKGVRLKDPYVALNPVLGTDVIATPYRHPLEGGTDHAEMRQSPTVTTTSPMSNMPLCAAADPGVSTYDPAAQIAEVLSAHVRCMGPVCNRIQPCTEYIHVWAKPLGLNLCALS
jgi:hypothetical protein